MSLGISESYRQLDKPAQQKGVDVRKEAERMAKRYENRITELREKSLLPDAFRRAVLRATEQFKRDLKTFLSKHGAEDMYEEMVGFTSGHVGEIVQTEKEGKT